MLDLVGVRFREIGKISYFKRNDLDIHIGDIIIAHTKRGIEHGKVIIIKSDAYLEDCVSTEEKIIRKADEKDLIEIEYNKQKEEEAYEICKSKISQHKIKMKLIDVEYMFDRSKIIFYFVSDGRVDFRSLVKDLAYVFRVRIELRQIGVRDESKMLGGLGLCGKPLCCATFLNKFQSVSIKMAKDQGISLNPSKISGVCGRLLCCLKYEEDVYLDLIDKMPRQGDVVTTKDGKGVVVGNNLISGKIKVLLDNSSETVPLTFDHNEVNVIEVDATL